jgi:competence protein ComEA
VADLSRSQIAAYGAIAVALLLLGARSIRAEPAGSAASGSARSGSSSSGAPFQLKEGSGDVVVHVAGEVSHPGVFRLPAGSRVADAVDRAGGITAKGAPDGINLAAKLSDGQQVIVPARAGPGAATAAGPGDGPVSLGSATLEQLDGIEGIGPVTAQKIIEYRTAHGGIGSVAELDRISGIGPATMQTLRDRLQP